MEFLHLQTPIEEEESKEPTMLDVSEVMAEVAKC